VTPRSPSSHAHGVGCRARRIVALGLTGALGLVGCGSNGEPPVGARPTARVSCGEGDVVDGRPLRVATTVAPITNIAANIAGGTDTEIVGVVPEGTNSHTFEPAPSVAATLEAADVVFINGLVLEEPTRQLALANLGDGAEVCEIGTTILPEEEYIFDFSFPEDGGKPNPHLWTNPPMGKQYAEVIRDVLVERDPGDAATYRANFETFSARVDSLDAAVRAATATIPPDDRQLLTYHDAYAYFAAEYGWTVLGAIQPSSFDEPTARDVADLIEQVEASGVPAIFGSEVFPSTVLEQIASETGAEYVDDLRDDDLPGAPGDPDHTWLALMRFNYVTMVAALGGDSSAFDGVDVSDVAADTAEYPQ
jgi:ABC-type Zn uptake system ZnuABC Zn-binding protein ZnuA